MEKKISNSTQCATRLRLVLKKEDDEMVQSVKILPGVIDVVQKGGQFQIIIGNTVDKVYNEFSELTGGEEKKEAAGTILTIKNRRLLKCLNFQKISYGAEH